MIINELFQLSSHMPVSHTMDTMELDWLDSPIEVDPGVMLLDFKLSDVTMYNCSQHYTAGNY